MSIVDSRRVRSPILRRSATARGSGVRASGDEQSRRANRPSDSNPASVEESAAAEQQHHEDDDEQCGRVHFLSPVSRERGPASSRPSNGRTERRRFGAFAVRITPTPTCRLTTAQAGVCSLLNTAIEAASPQARDSRLGERWKMSVQPGTSGTRPPAPPELPAPQEPTEPGPLTAWSPVNVRPDTAL
jgi:hypothetical protein